jgi:hypothetical protein
MKKKSTASQANGKDPPLSKCKRATSSAASPLKASRESNLREGEGIIN